MMSKIFDNWPWKLLSLFFSIILWFMIVNYQDPITTKRIDSVEVDIINENAITAQKRAISYIDGTMIKLELKGKRSKINRLIRSDIKATADLSKVSITGAIDIDVSVPDGLEIISKKPSVMTISMEKIKSNLKTCMPFFEGEVAEGYLKLAPTLVPNQIQITGTQSKLGTVSKVIVPINVENAKNDITLFVTPQVLDGAGNEIEGLTLSNDRIEVKLPVQKEGELKVELSPKGKLQEDYVLKYMRPSKSRIRVRGYEEDLLKHRKININSIDLSKLNENSRLIKIRLQDYMPENIYLLDENDIEVVLKIEKLEKKKMFIPNSSIKKINEDKGRVYRFAENGIFVTIKGSSSDINKVSLKSLAPSVDFTNSKIGEHEYKVNLTIPTNIELLDGENNIKVNVEENVPERTSVTP